MNLAETTIELADGPLRRRMARRWLQDKSMAEIVHAIGGHEPKDVLQQQALLADAEGSIFVALINTVLCDWGSKMAGVKRAEHVYFLAVQAGGEEGRRAYLQNAYRLGKDLWRRTAEGL